MTGERAGAFPPTLRCDWWFSVVVDGSMEAALLQLVGGSIHHSPVQVCCTHLICPHLIFPLCPSKPGACCLDSVFICLINPRGEFEKNLFISSRADLFLSRSTNQNDKTKRRPNYSQNTLSVQGSACCSRALQHAAKTRRPKSHRAHGF